MRVSQVGGVTIVQGDALESLRLLDDQSVHCCVTSPPYWGLRDYGEPGQLGLEPTPDEYVANLVAVFREVRRVLRDDGTVWLNLGDSYSRSPKKGGSGTPNGRNIAAMGYGTAQAAKSGSSDGAVGRAERPGSRAGGLASKNLIGIPWRVAFALQSDGWILRQDIIWAKPNPMPESVTDRCTKSHEYIFLLSKSPKYYFDSQAIKEPTVTRDSNVRDRETTRLNNTPGRKRMEGLCTNDYEFRNKRSVWTVTTKPFKAAHFATFPPDLIEPCILAGCPVGGMVLDPFGGSGTTGLVAQRHGRQAVLLELNSAYIDIAVARLQEAK